MNSDNVKKVNKTSSAYRTLAFTTFRRTMWVPIVWAVLLVVLNMVMLEGIGSYYRQYDHMIGYTFADIADELNEMMPQFIVSIIFSAFFGAMQFSYLTRINSVGFIHSLPVSRNGIFASYYLSGVVSVLIPQVVMMLNMMIVPWKHRILFAFLVFVVGALYSVGVYSVGVMMSMFSAKSIGCVLFTVFGLASPYLAENFVRMIMINNLYGYYENSEYWITENLYLIPRDVMSPKGFIYLAVIVIFTLLSWILYKRRYSELAGDLVAYPGIRGIATVICAVFAGVCGYLMFGGSLFHFGLFGIICGVLVNFAVKKRFEVVSSLVHAGILTGITVVIVCVFTFDITGFENRIPDIDDIESVVVSERYHRSNILYYTGNDGYVYTDDECYRIKDKDKIETVIKFHEDLLGNKDFYESSAEYTYTYTRPYESSWYDPGNSANFIIEYKLKGGGTLIRSYRAYHGRNRDTLMAIVELPETKVYDHPILREDTKVNYARLETPAGVVSLTAQEAEIVRKALAQDITDSPAIKERGLNDFRSPSVTSLIFEFVYTKAVDEKGRTIIEPEIFGKHSGDTKEFIYPHYVNTLKVLRELGFGEYLDYENIDEGFSVAIEKHKARSDNGTNIKTDVYYPVRSEDAEFVKAVMSYAFSVSSENCKEMYDTAYMISYENKPYGSEASNGGGFMIYGEVDFIEQWLAGMNPEKDNKASYEGMPYVGAYEKAVSVDYAILE